MYKIMLADDEGIVIDSLKFIIEKEFGDKCIIEFAKTGRSVIELAESFRPDIAIMDIQMHLSPNSFSMMNFTESITIPSSSASIILYILLLRLRCIQINAHLGSCVLPLTDNIHYIIRTGK